LRRKAGRKQGSLTLEDPTLNVLEMTRNGGTLKEMDMALQEDLYQRLSWGFELEKPNHVPSSIGNPERRVSILKGRIEGLVL
jgi:hypothetical protein